MNILVTGSNGQLGSELRKIAATDQLHQWFFTDVKELDITQKDQVEGFFKANLIEACLNCAAYTAVDKAEDEPLLVEKINATAVGVLADACFKNEALLVHISTDYVFNGENFKPYDEKDTVSAVSVYGLTKAKAELILASHLTNSVILRTSWLYSATGNNFVKTMLRLGKEKPEIRVVADQIGTPTWAFDLAWAIMLVVDLYDKKPVKEIYHFSNEGVISWYDFAQTIMELKELNCKVIPIASSEYPVKTKRPFYSVLDKSKFKKQYKINIPYWKDSLKRCLEELDGQEQS
ncbi:MAG: dTDP-4-dehydrorhamnose reductase [Bacteroidetes bacterium HGW-Bacteroidetes-1]|jgi:dTDP-4-dehydrorhamnose reductase|nr:MAG: dTDP-4-dehydrorhamnose reductase [Bacteroidetes bacterium HGW-Bacteroidetes-1]